MLFLLNGAGVPSLASSVRLASPDEDTTPPGQPSDLTATASAAHPLKRYIPYSQEQDFLLPPSILEGFRSDSLATFVSETVEWLDRRGKLEGFEQGGRGDGEGSGVLFPGDGGGCGRIAGSTPQNRDGSVPPPRCGMLLSFTDAIGDPLDRSPVLGGAEKWPRNRAATSLPIVRLFRLHCEEWR